MDETVAEIAELAEWALAQCDGDREAAVKWLEQMAAYLHRWEQRRD